MKIRMLLDQYIAPDGIATRMYEKGEEFEVGTTEMPFDVAEELLADKRAEEVKPKVSVHQEEEQRQQSRVPGPKETK